MASLSRSAHRRHAKIRRTYREPDSESDISYDSRRETSRPTRSSRQIQTYRETSTSGLSDDVSSTSDSGVTPLPQSQSAIASVTSNRGRRNPRRSQRTKCHTLKRSTIPLPLILNSFKRQKTSHRDPKEVQPLKDKPGELSLIPVNINAPAWQTLEYRILFKILQYAAYPLYSSALRSQPSINWLMSVAKLSKSFYDAAVAALLWEPPLLPHSRAHGLIKVLSQDQDRLAMNYRTKIRSLNIEAQNLILKKRGIAISDLLSYTPLLIHLRIFHWHDEMIGKAIWAEPTVAQMKWSYDNLFNILVEHNIRLKSFEWNGRFQDTVSAMQVAHKQSCMTDLRALSILNLNFSEKQEEERILARDMVISALASLPNIEEIEFRNCTILDITAMTRMPLGLKCLKVVNCLSITSDAIASYLSLGGYCIRTLHLEGNQVMDLGFMPKLSELCPHLEKLFVDLSYEDCSSYHDRNPLYDDLLPNGSPTWPSALTSIVIGPLRSLDVSDAENFYNSLIEAAEGLPYLRILSVRTILNHASWRDRARLRTKWRPLFEKVFAANKPYVPTISKVKPMPKPKNLPNSQRKSARLQELEEISSSEESNEVEESIATLSTLPRQNRCEIVEFDLSDQRPAQEQFREDDFLDSEPSGDEEWNGRDQTISGPGYAW